MNKERAQDLSDRLTAALGEKTGITTHAYVAGEFGVFVHDLEAEHLLITTSEEDDDLLYVGMYEPGLESRKFIVTAHRDDVVTVARAMWGGAFV